MKNHWQHFIEYDPISPDKAFVIFYTDAVKLFFAGTFTPNKFKINENILLKIDLNLDSEDLIKLYEKYSREYIVEQWLLRDIAKRLNIVRRRIFSD